MGIHIPEELIQKQATTASLQFSVDNVKQQIHSELEKLGIDDPKISRNSEILSLALTHVEALDNILGNGLEVDKIRRNFIYGNAKNQIFDLDQKAEVLKYLKNNKESGLYVGDKKIYIQDIDEGELSNTLLKVIFPKYIEAKLH